MPLLGGGGILMATLLSAHNQAYVEGQVIMPAWQSEKSRQSLGEGGQHLQHLSFIHLEEGDQGCG